MKVNRPKSPFVSGADAPDEKDIARTVKGDKFAEALSSLESAAADGAASPARSALTEIAVRYDLSDENSRESALRESAEFLVKSRLGDEQGKSEKMVKDLGKFVAEDPFLKTKLLSVLQNLSNDRQ